MAGHLSQRCLRVWHLHTDSHGTKTRFVKNHASLMWCMECGDKGHFKCTSAKRSGKVRVCFKVKEGIVMEESQSLEQHKAEGSSLRDIEIGCAGCGSKRHDVAECNDKRGN